MYVSIISIITDYSNVNLHVKHLNKILQKQFIGLISVLYLDSFSSLCLVESQPTLVLCVLQTITH